MVTAISTKATSLISTSCSEVVVDASSLDEDGNISFEQLGDSRHSYHFYRYRIVLIFYLCPDSLIKNFQRSKKVMK